MTKVTLSMILLFLSLSSIRAQDGAATNPYLEKINKTVPHTFKSLKTGATIEVERVRDIVKVYMLIDDIEQYEQLLLERSDDQQTNYAQCRVILIEKGKYKENYLEVVDRYPVSSKMTNLYRLKAITEEGNMMMFPPVPITQIAAATTKTN